MQDELFRRTRGRLDTSRVSIRNAVAYRKLKARADDVEWPAIHAYLQDLANDITTYQPEIIVAFGRFGFEFRRRAAGEEERRPYGYWNTQRLGEEFRIRLASTAQPLVLPLLHVSVSAGEFLSGQRDFTGQDDGNYFEYVGKALAEVALERLSGRAVWL